MNILIGKLMDIETRCKSYVSVKDFMEIKFYRCNTFYTFFTGDREQVNHALGNCPKEKFNTKAILCGVCRTEMTIETYMNHNACPECGSVYNENCQLHYPIYFDV